MPGAPKAESLRSEHELAAQLQRTRAIVACDLAEIGVMVVQVDALRVGVVEGVERLEAQVDMRLFRWM